MLIKNDANRAKSSVQNKDEKKKVNKKSTVGRQWQIVQRKNEQKNGRKEYQSYHAIFSFLLCRFVYR